MNEAEISMMLVMGLGAACSLAGSLLNIPCPGFWWLGMWIALAAATGLCVFFLTGCATAHSRGDIDQTIVLPEAGNGHPSVVNHYKTGWVLE